jgi:hypothetical protein
VDDFQIIFTALRDLLKAYQPPLVSRVDDTSHFDLWSEKDLVIEGRKRKDIYFAGVTIHKNFVGFYFMPVYAGAEVMHYFDPQLLKLLKGKSCFHITKLDDALKQQIKQALSTGFELYQQRGWI